MDTNTISILIGIIGCIVGVSGWLYNRDNKKDNDAEWKGCVNEKLDKIIELQKEMKDTKIQLLDHEKRITILEQKNK